MFLLRCFFSLPTNLQPVYPEPDACLVFDEETDAQGQRRHTVPLSYLPENTCRARSPSPTFSGLSVLQQNTVCFQSKISAWAHLPNSSSARNRPGRLTRPPSPRGSHHAAHGRGVLHGRPRGEFPPRLVNLYTVIRRQPSKDT